MDLYRLQEIPGVFLVVAVLVGTTRSWETQSFSFKKSSSKALRLAKTGVALLEDGPMKGTAPPKGQWSMRFRSNPRFGLPR
jgi:hypothetical protein